MLYQLEDVERLVDESPGLHVRFSPGLVADLEAGASDPETGLELPGFAAWPLDPEPWWSLPTTEWIARQLVRATAPEVPDGFAWLLRGRAAGRDADGRPLLADVEVVGRVAECMLAEADRVWRRRAQLGSARRDDALTLAASA